VALERAWIDSRDVDRIRAAFETEYLRLFGRKESAVPAEIVSWRLTASGPRPHIDLRSVNAGNSKVGAASLRGSRPVFDPAHGSFSNTPVHDRYAIAPGVELQGPLIIEERESTVVVPSRATVRCSPGYSLLIDLPTSAQ